MAATAAAAGAAAARRSIARYLRPCPACSTSILPGFPLKHAALSRPVAQFTTTTAAWARKGRSTSTSSEEVKAPRSDQAARLADELADKILDDFFKEDGAARQSSKKAANRDALDEGDDLMSGGDRMASSSEAKGAVMDAPRAHAAGEIPMPNLPSEWGSNALPRNQYAAYGIESDEARDTRRGIVEDYTDVGKEAEDAEASPLEADDWYVDQAFNLPGVVPGNATDKALNPNDFVPRWMAGIAVAERRSQGVEPENAAGEPTGPLRLQEIVSVLREEKGANMAVISMRDKCDYTDFMIIVEGRSTKQIYALADAVRRRAKHRTLHDVSLPTTLTIEGADSEDWMVLDLGRFIVHCFTPEARARYNLEGLWTAIKDPLLALAREDEIETGEQQLEEAGRGWDTRPQEEYRIKQIERKHMLAEDEVLEKFNATR
ncbi:hypothetical protein HKX48_002285 [Thoreauomyces humboldtii]|nr:hypothetical protein HKX48_002285 [Thoreauomyces humboldtii]